jgi:hypothetical protein
MKVSQWDTEEPVCKFILTCGGCALGYLFRRQQTVLIPNQALHGELVPPNHTFLHGYGPVPYASQSLIRHNNIDLWDNFQ